MKIAISSRDHRRLTGHAGKAKEWLLFEGERGAPAAPAGQITLTGDQVFHYFKGPGPHPLDGVAVILTRSAGDGFLNRMAKRGVEVRMTRETNAAKAADDYLAGRLAPAPAAGLQRLICKIRDRFSEHR